MEAEIDAPSAAKTSALATAPAEPDPRSISPRAVGLIRVASPSIGALNKISNPGRLPAVSLPWKYLSVGGQQLSIVFSAGDGDCVTLAGYYAIESSTQVELFVLGAQQPSGSLPSGVERGCASMNVIETGTVALRQPIGRRQLLHPPVSSLWSKSLDGLPS